MNNSRSCFVFENPFDRNRLAFIELGMLKIESEWAWKAIQEIVAIICVK